jgi:hypothetical protein
LRRSIVIHVLDIDAVAPRFGANALAALQATGFPLAGTDVTLAHLPYSWDNTAPLGRLVAELAAQGAMIAVSSEGALFDYGDDDVVVANLKALQPATHQRSVRVVTGSVTRTDAVTRTILANSRLKLIPRGVHSFAALAARASFSVAETRQALISDQILLRPQKSPGT